MASRRAKPADYIPEKFWEDRYSSLDLTRSGHRDLPESYNRWLYRRKQSVLASVLRRAGFVARGKDILEIGVGTGVYVDWWHSLGAASITGTDLSGTAIDHLQKRHREYRFCKQDVTDPAAGLALQATFDLVTALDVLYHVVDDTRLEVALRNIVKWMRPGGLCAVHDQFLHRPSEHHGYIKWRSLHDWTRLLDSVGLEIVSRTPIFYLMIQPTDCISSVSQKWMWVLWGYTSKCIRRWPGMVGAAAYFMDRMLSTFIKEGPSMEVVLLRVKERTSGP